MISIKYQNIYNQFIQNYKKIHIDPYHEITEDEIASIYNELVNSMDITDDYTFYYFVNYIIKRLNGKSDAHTKLDMVSIMPINFKLFDDAVIVNYPEELKGASLKAINGVDIIQILNEMDNILTYGTTGKKRFEIEKGLFNRYTMFSLPSLRNSEELSYEFETLDGHIITKKFDRKINEIYGKIFDYKYKGTYDVGSFYDSYQHPIYLELCPEAKSFEYLISNNYREGKELKEINLYHEIYLREEVKVDIKSEIDNFINWLKSNNLYELYCQKWESVY